MNCFKTNQKGVLYSVMLLLIILSMLALFTTLREVRQDLSLSTTAEISNVSSVYNNLSELVLTIDKTGFPKAILNRTLPFSTTVDNNTVTFTKKLSISTSFFDETTNSLNLAKVFVEDTNYNNVFDGVTKNINLDNSLSWGTQTNEITSLISPFCYTYFVDTNSFSLESTNSGNCNGVFQENNIKKLIFDVNLKSTTSDYNTITCSGISCSQDSYNPINPLPYFSLTLDQNYCTSCKLPLSNISNHFDPSTPFSITISCTGASCTSEPITITQNNLTITGNTKEDYVYTSQSIEFDKEISDVTLVGVDINVLYNNALKKG